MSHKMKSLDKIKQEIRTICTYYSELGEGTAGYSLSEAQFQKLFDLFETKLIEAKEAGREEAEEKARTMRHVDLDKIIRILDKNIQTKTK